MPFTFVIETLRPSGHVISSQTPNVWMQEHLSLNSLSYQPPLLMTMLMTMLMMGSCGNGIPSPRAMVVTSMSRPMMESLGTLVGVLMPGPLEAYGP